MVFLREKLRIDKARTLLGQGGTPPKITDTTKLLASLPLPFRSMLAESTSATVSAVRTLPELLLRTTTKGSANSLRRAL